MNPPMVSVLFITYNHAKFVRKALESILMQQTTFPFKIIVGDDKSTDGTREIIEEMAVQHPDKIILSNPDKNIGPAKNFIQLLTACQNSNARYIAYLEGDDYWTDTGKLQKQVDFLEANPDFSICFHKAKIEYEEGIVPFYPDINANTPEVTTIEDIATGNYIHSPSVVFRNVLKVKEMPDWYETAFPGDWPLHVMNACHGKIRFMQDEMCVYRVHSNGTFSTQRNEKEISKYLPTIKNLAAYLNKRFPLLSKKLNKYYSSLFFKAFVLRNEGNKSRISRAALFIKYGFILNSKKAILFFWLPLLFGNKTEVIWNKF
jgi:glycosyltransferase involved in cell wall biosynthesis